MVRFADQRGPARHNESPGNAGRGGASEALTILVAGYDFAFLSLLIDRVRSWPDLAIVEGAFTEHSALAACERIGPAVVVIETSLTKGDPFQLSASLRARWPSVRIVFVAGFVNDRCIYNVQRSSADGLVWKIGTVIAELRNTVDAVLAGGRRFPPEFQALVDALRSRPGAFFKILSSREMDILPLFGRDLSDEEISAEMKISPATVRRHRYRIMERLGLHRSAELGRWSREVGFSPPASPAPPCVFVER